MFANPTSLSSTNHSSTSCERQYRCFDDLSPRWPKIPLGADGVNLVNENNGGCMLLCHPEELPHQLGPISQVLLDQLRAHHTQEGG